MKLGVRTDKFTSQPKNNRKHLKLGFGISIIVVIWTMYLTGNTYIVETVSVTSIIPAVLSHLNLTHLIANTIGIIICIAVSLSTKKRFAVPFFMFAVLGHVFGLLIIDVESGILGISGGTYGYVSYIKPKIGVAAIVVSIIRILFIPWGAAAGHEIHIGVSILGLSAYLSQYITYSEYSYQTHYFK